MYNPANEVSSINFSAIIGGALNAVVNAQKESAETTVNFVRQVGFMPGKLDENGRETGIGDPICVSFSYDKEVSPAHTTESREFRIEVMDGGSGYKDANNIVLKIGEIDLDANVMVEDGKIVGAVLNAEPTGDDIKNNAEIKVTEENGGNKAKLVLKVVDEGKLSPALYQKMRIDVPILTMMPIPFIKIDNTDIEFNVKINSVSTTETKDTTNSSVKSDSNFSYKGLGIKAGTTLNASVSNQKSTSSNETVKKDYSLNIKVHAVQDDMPAGMAKILDILEETISTKAVSSPAAKEALTDENSAKKSDNSSQSSEASENK
ncbi:MAG: DUF2589 domain-containing protein [Oscillospiraceae bacterium]|nr:DUF2589 domain-containing protein [Oscillospiraceae bacterium]